MVATPFLEIANNLAWESGLLPCCRPHRQQRCTGHHVRTADIELEAGNAGRIIEGLHDTREVCDLIPHHVHEDFRALEMLSKPRQMLCADFLDPWVREPYRVDHSAIKLGDSGCRGS